MNKRHWGVAWLGAVLLFGGAVWAETPAADPAAAEKSDAAAEPNEYTAASGNREVFDPMQCVNRGIFWFNDELDIHVAEPVARGYEKITPDRVRTGIGNFFKNLQYPAFLLSDLVQLKFKQALSDTGRFLINTTIGVGGVMDIAKDWGLKRHKEDFGVALAYWGVPPGPYLVLPILGPTNFRDALGLAVNAAADPLYWTVALTDMKPGEQWAVALGTETINFVNTRANLLEAVSAAKESSLDYYLFMQSAYDQYRAGIVKDARGEAQGGDELEDDLLNDKLE